jgi:hypothetical protein
MRFCRCECRFLLAIDPGLATGVSLIDLSDPDNPVKVWSVEVTTEEFYDKIEDLIRQPETHVCIERYKIGEEATDSPWSLELIGIVKLMCYRYGKDLDIQLPSAAKEFATNDKLRAVGFWHVGGEGHANDSLRHAMIWIVNRNRKWTRKLLV